MEFTDHGTPILSLEQKITAATVCIEEKAYEDAAGHLCDLLEYCRERIEPSDGSKIRGLIAMVRIYGRHPAPIMGS